MHDLSKLTPSERKKRHRALDAVQHRRSRGSVSESDYQAFVTSVNVQLDVPKVVQADEIVLVGKKFGRLTVSGFAKNVFGQTTALCSCACGKSASPTISKLASGASKSCGCLRSTRQSKGPDSAIVSSVRTTYKASAKQRGLPFELDHFSIRRLMLSNCFYCGIPPYREWTILRAGGVEALKCNGIDRIDNLRGYTPDNVVACCPRCNYAKRDMPLQEFTAWALRLAKHLQEHNVLVGSSTPAESKNTTNAGGSN